MRVELVKQPSPERDRHHLILTGENDNDYEKLEDIVKQSTDGYNFYAGVPTVVNDRVVALSVPLNMDQDVLL